MPFGGRCHALKTNLQETRQKNTTKSNSIIDTAQECNDVEDHTIVADSIGYGRLYAPITNMTRGRAENRRSGWSITPKVMITIEISPITLHRRRIL